MRYLLLSLFPVLAYANSTATSGLGDNLGLADQPSIQKSDPIEFQLNFNRDAPKGIDAAAQISQEVIQQQPTFGLHDSTGISQSSYFGILMLDTTDSTDPILHYLHGDFQADGDIKADLISNSKPLVSYHAPGTLGEASGPRHYTFLLYEQTEGVGLEYDTSSPLLDGFNQELFESDNGLNEPIAGLAISVTIDANYVGGNNGHDNDGDDLPTIGTPAQSSPNRSITTTKVIGGTTTHTSSKRSIPSVITISGEVISGYTPDAIPFTTSTKVLSGVPGSGGKAMVTVGGASSRSTAGASPAAGGLPKGDNPGGLGTLVLMATMGTAMVIALVLL